MTLSIVLSITSASELIGKKIKWTCPGYIANGNYSGIDVITSVNPSFRMPLTTEVVSGDDLSFAFNWESGTLCYSDGGRFITYEIIN